MGFFVLLLVASVIGLGLVAFWWLSGLNMKYTSLVGSLLQGLIVTPLLAVGGVAAFLLFSHLIGVPDVAASGTDSITDVLLMVGILATLGGPALGLMGYYVDQKWG